MLSPIQTRLLKDSPAPPSRARRPRVRLLRGGRSRTLPLPLAEPEAPAFGATKPAPDPATLRVMPAPPAIDPVDLLGDVVRESGGIRTLSVRGEAMRDALLGDGDVVMLQPGSRVTSGELAAVRLRGEGSLALRRVYFENGHVRLQPENHGFPPLVVDPAEVEIEGRVLAIIRQAGR